MNKSVPSVVVVAAVAAVAIQFGNALADLATVAGGAMLAWWGFSHFQRKIGDLKTENRELKEALRQVDQRNRELQAASRSALTQNEFGTSSYTEPSVVKPRGFFRKR